MPPSADLGAVTVRAAQPADAGRIAALMVQLGYNVPGPEVAARLRRLDERRRVFVAVVNGEIAGWAGALVDETLTTGRCGFIEGFVVDEAARSRGVGGHLLAALEAWLRERGCDAVRVQSNVVRERAHVFYERHGYGKVKAQYQLRKTL